MTNVYEVKFEYKKTANTGTVNWKRTYTENWSLY